MALTNDQITAQNFKDFYGQIRPYLNGSAHGGFTPIGTVISVMGKQAPHNYLVCDGTIYNIADYPELAAYFVGQFEASNFFGGDGITTFAVPDLRGEFLRGSGTNSHTDGGNGANVGVHQGGTALPEYLIYTDGRLYSKRTSRTDSNFISGEDKSLVGVANVNYSSQFNPNQNYADNTSTIYKRYVRPTNTSVLYCIATKNIFMDAGCNYSTDEQVVGAWVDGKPIYQKTYNLTNTVELTKDNWTVINEVNDLANVDAIIDCNIFTSGGTFMVVHASLDSNKLKLGAPSSNNFRYIIKTVTIKYIKATD